MRQFDSAFLPAVSETIESNPRPKFLTVCSTFRETLFQLFQHRRYIRMSIIFGTPDADTIIANNEDNFIFGLGGNDIIDARDGNDFAFGGDGDDTIFGQNQDDVVVGGNGNDTLYGGDGSDKLFGGHGNDTLFGDNEDDMLFGGNGNDFLSGGLGDDMLAGGRGSDVLSGDAGNDIFVFNLNTDGTDVDTVIGFKAGEDKLLIQGAAPNAEVKYNSDTGILSVGGQDVFQLDPGLHISDDDYFIA